MAGFIRVFWNAMVERSKMTDEEYCAQQEKIYPGFTERYMGGKEWLADRHRERTASACQKTYGRTWGGSFSDTSDPAVAAHLLAARGALDPKVAFLAGAPGAPNGTGRLVGLNGAYEG